MKTSRISLAEVRDRITREGIVIPELSAALDWLEGETEITGYDYPRALASLLLVLAAKCPHCAGTGVVELVSGELGECNHK